MNVQTDQQFGKSGCKRKGYYRLPVRPRAQVLTGIMTLLFALLQPWTAMPFTASAQSCRVSQLKVNQRLCVDRHSGELLFVGGLHPQLSWELVAGSAAEPAKGREQIADPLAVSAYQVLVATNRTAIENAKKEFSGVDVDEGNAKKAKVGGLLWNTGRRELTAGDLFQVVYNGPVLLSDQPYYWCVRVWTGAEDKVSHWSRTGVFRTALLDRKDWGGARWIGQAEQPLKDRVLPGDTAVKVLGADGQERKRPFGTDNDTLPLLRRAFKLTDKPRRIKKATLYISGLGQFEARLNGQKLGDHFLDPGWTNYQKEALFVAFDVKDQLRAGVNVLGVALGNGFYFVPAAKDWYKKLLVQYGFPKMICRLSIQYESGKRQDIVSDRRWQVGRSSILFSSIYGGELEDGRLRSPGWDRPGFDRAASRWKPARLVTDTPLTLRYQQIDPVKIMEKFSPEKIYTVQNGAAGWTFDMGQNCSGIPAVWLRGQKGDTVTLTVAELMNADYSANQKATGKYKLIYVLGKDGPQQWHPQFTYYGFRYVQVEGAVPPGTPNPAGLPVLQKLETWHIRNSAPAAGSFSCSSDLFNKTNELIRWGMKSNMVSVFTDCPHREKLGWLEQVHLMGSSVRYNWQIQHLLKKSLQDMRSAQTPEGLIPEVAPEFTVFTWGGDMFRDSPEWGSSGIIVPWYLYQWYGDSTELRKSYPMMNRYMDYLRTKAKDHILYQGLGDWYDLGPDRPGTSQLTPKGLTATAIYYYDLQILEQIAGLLGKPADRQNYAREARLVRQAFNQKFLHQGMDAADSMGAGQKQVYYGTGSQTADAMALYMRLVPSDLRAQVLEHLVKGIIKGNYALTAGDIGYRYLLRVLEAEGYSDLIFKMNNRSDVPGYGYQIAHGATALTESWQALPSVSNNHFMLGHLMEWFYSGILGIRMDLATADNQKGMAPLTIAPQLVNGLDWAKGHYETPYGKVSVDWKRDKEDSYQVTVQVPVGLTADLRLPYRQGAILKNGAVGAEQRQAEVIQAEVVTTKRAQKIFAFKAGAGTHVYTVSVHGR